MNTFTSLSGFERSIDRLISTSFWFLVFVWLAHPAMGATNSIEISGGSNESPGAVGFGYRNRYTVPSKAEAQEKLKALQALGRPVTLREFLGGEIQFVRITFYYPPLDSVDRARRLMREILDLVVISPDRGNSGMILESNFSEPHKTTIRAVVQFSDGRIGRIECDATDDGSRSAGGVHLFLEDRDGTYWWHRSAAEFGRKKSTTQ